MFSNRILWSVTMLAGAAVIACLPAIAAGLRDGEDEVEQAKAIARLVEDGQVPLATAVLLAERHAKGTAVGASTQVETQQPPAGEGASEAGAAGAIKAGGEVILYRVRCLDNARVKLVTLEVNGRTREIKEVSSEAVPSAKDPAGG